MRSIHSCSGAIPLLCLLRLLRNKVLSIHRSRGWLHVQCRGEGCSAGRNGSVRVLATIGVGRLGSVAIGGGSLRVGKKLSIPPGVLSWDCKILSRRSGKAGNGAVGHRDGAVGVNDIRLNAEGLDVVRRVRLRRGRWNRSNGAIVGHAVAAHDLDGVRGEKRLRASGSSCAGRHRGASGSSGSTDYPRAGFATGDGGGDELGSRLVVWAALADLLRELADESPLLATVAGVTTEALNVSRIFDGLKVGTPKGGVVSATPPRVDDQDRPSPHNCARRHRESHSPLLCGCGSAHMPAQFESAS